MRHIIESIVILGVCIGVTACSADTMDAEESTPHHITEESEPDSCDRDICDPALTEDARPDTSGDAVPDMNTDGAVDMEFDMMPDLGPETIPCNDGGLTCTRSPHNPQKYCCPREEPSCDCPYMGGTMNAVGYCMNTCDAAPVGWTTMTDENGCEYNIPGSESCL